MGQFSWLDCKTGEQVLDNVKRNVYVLVPKEFGGGHIKEECYDGYGDFGGHDVYDLVADWNREHLAKEMLQDILTTDYSKGDEKYYIYGLKRQIHTVQRLMDFKSGLPDDQMQEKYEKDYKREIGIDIACYDNQNMALPYPIKITHDPNAVYEDCEPSLSDPNQGWK